MTRPVEVRARLVDILRRDLVGPGPQDADLARERLSENPSRWYLTGFVAPQEDAPAEDDPAVQEEDERAGDEEAGPGAGGAAGDDDPAEAPASRRRFLPSSVGLTVLLPMDVESIEARVSWGDYVTEPPLPQALLRAEGDDDGSPRAVDWVRVPQQRAATIPIATGRGSSWVPDSSPAEAYLGLAAFAIAHRRLSNSGVLGADVTVIMRYTLRLLTLDQLARAAGVICALELMRGEAAYVEEGRRLLGDWPIEIGLWVGSDASPNRLGGRGDTGEQTAVTRVRRFAARGGRAPAPIKACPWCGTPFGRQSFQCVPNMVTPRNLEIRCANIDCDFAGNRALPVLTVDEPIYRRLPAFLVATVDKFASLPWVGECGAFFGHVDHFEDGVGFHGATAPGGRRLFNDASLDPPDLIIQDELHLISGPLGTVAGLYETAIDRLATRAYRERRIRPKIVASTATVRRASEQIRALFDRDATAVFPPPGLDRTDSFFAQTLSADQSPARWYLGLAAQGRGPKLVFLRALTTLVAAAQAEYEAAAAALAAGERNPADPFMTAVCYFNALRELGGARRIVEDEVRDRAARYGSERRRVSPPDAPFRDRRIGESMELTSRVSTDQVAEAKRRLETGFGGSGETVDVALATNMISVGLDILRLGLMLVQGQPKTAAEYIQATSRVGRDPERPGLVVTVLNLHKPRDRTHYEQFGQFHRTFYRAVEATSVTPWAARALDRALAAVVVAIARHIDPDLTPEAAVTRLANRADVRARVRDAIADRAPPHLIVGGRQALERSVDVLMIDWIATAAEITANGSPFYYGRTAQRLLHVPLDPALPNLPPAHRRFVAGRSMRDVEPNTVLKPRDPYNNPIAGDEDAA